jgi:DNA-directed RNA polymerase I subunit RPA49
MSLRKTFGSHKDKQKIRAMERNQVDSTLLHGEVADLMMADIAGGSEGMPTKEQVQEEADRSRPIPSFNAHAARPNLVYPIESVIPAAEMEILPVKYLLDAKKERYQDFLGWRMSPYINTRFNSALETSGEKDRPRLGILLYLSYLIAFYNLKVPHLNNPRTLRSSLGHNCPSSVIDSFLKRFTEKNTKDRFRWTKFTKDKIVCYGLVLCLHLDNFNSDCAALQSDLSLGPRKMKECFKALGCKIGSLTDEERLQLKISKTESRTMRHARLTVPLRFPACSGGAHKK